MSGLQRALLYAGFVAPLVYVTTVVVGGLATPGYSQMDQPVSALFETGAPHAVPVSLAFVGYNLLLLAFGIGLWVRRQGRIGRLTSVMILLNGGCGLVIELAPMDPVGDAATLAGTAHLILAAMLVVTCMAAMASQALQWRQDNRPRLVGATVALLVLMLVAGALAAIAATASWPLLGLFQRFTIGSYLIWLPMVAVVALRPPFSAGSRPTARARYAPIRS